MVYSFSANQIEKVKIICLRWNLVPHRLIRITYTDLHDETYPFVCILEWKRFF